MENSSILRSRPGFVYLLIGLFLVAVLGLVFYSLQDNYLLYGALGLLLVWLLLTWISLRLEVHQEYFEIRSLWGNRKLSWEQMAAVKPTLGLAAGISPFQFFISLSNFKSRRTLLMLFPFHNREELLKAIINASWRANPNVRLSSSLTARYGFPPYSRTARAKKQ